MSSVQVDRREGDSFFLLSNENLFSLLRQKKKRSADFDWALGLNRLGLDFMGVWPRERQPDTFARMARLPLMVVWIVVSLILPEIYALMQYYRDLQLAADNLWNTLIASASVVKLSLLWYRREVLQQAIRVSSIDWLSDKSSRERDLMLRQASRARLFTLAGYATMFGCVFGFLVAPLFGLSIRLVNNITDSPSRHLPQPTYYPYDVTISPYFELTYVTQLIGTALLGLTLTVPEGCFVALLFHAAAQCEILAERCRGLALPHPRRELRAMVDMHVRLIRFVDAIEMSFNMCVLSTVIALAIITACIAFIILHIIGSEQESLQVIQLIVLISGVSIFMISMFVYCLASEILAENSTKLADAAYYSSCKLVSHASAKDFFIIMMRSQIPLHMSAGKFFYLSLNAYLQFVKTTGAYVSMMLTIAQ